METVLSRYNCLIEERKSRIRHLENILSGKDKRYSYDLVAAKENLNSEKELLGELLTDEYYQELLKKEREKLLLELC